jgi:hypothetical protein
MKLDIAKSVDKKGKIIDAVVTISKDYGEVKLTLAEFQWIADGVDDLYEGELNGK